MSYWEQSVVVSSESELLARFEMLLAHAHNERWTAAKDLLREFPELADARDSGGQTLLIRLAGIAGAAPLLVDLVGLGADPNGRAPDGETALTSAVRGYATGKSTADELSALLSLGADPELLGGGGMTALELATCLGRSELRRLIERAMGATPSAGEMPHRRA